MHVVRKKKENKDIDDGDDVKSTDTLRKLYYIHNLISTKKKYT